MSALSARADSASAIRAAVAAMPLDQIDPSDAQLFVDDTVGYYFERLRRDDPVHKTMSPIFGEYWSVTKYTDIMHVDTHPAIFSSEWTHGGITLVNPPPGEELPMFIAMDPPKHDEQRKAVSPIVGPANLARMEGLIRERTCAVLDALPRNETFDWVDRVSIELTTLMLATLFDFPLEDRRLLTWWSDVSTMNKAVNPNALDPQERMAELGKMLAYFTRLWNERVNAPPRTDLVSMLAHGASTRDMSPMEFMGNLVLLIVGGNDTTRNSMTGGLLALHDNPEQFAKLPRQPGVDREPGARDHPLADAAGLHAAAPAIADSELGGKLIRKATRWRCGTCPGNRDGRGDRECEPVHHRPRAAAAAPGVRVRHPPVRREPPARKCSCVSCGRRYCRAFR
jgi:cytochrome P450